MGATHPTSLKNVLFSQLGPFTKLFVCLNLTRACAQSCDNRKAESFNIKKSVFYLLHILISDYSWYLLDDSQLVEPVFLVLEWTVPLSFCLIIGHL